MARPERQILEHAVHTIAEQAAKADDLVDEAIEVGHGRSDPLVTHAKMLRLELLKVKADLERELEDLSLNCTKCGLDVHWVQGSGSPPDIGHTGAGAARRAGGLIRSRATWTQRRATVHDQVSNNLIAAQELPGRSVHERLISPWSRESRDSEHGRMTPVTFQRRT
jgi:hypothetical protein